ncbi:winged helix-turn-helix transcriptional regulator [Lentzea sp. NPDC003310]|uniref:winged helix-turn-helix transcriptional regulator n=1 Tax=Lentzea sp. NPDC003310 TaxID=3154447 RepID=UPI0033B8017E
MTPPSPELRELEADGLVERVETGPVPAPVIYRLTPYGETVRVWGEAHLLRTHGDAAPTAAMSCAASIA